MKLLSMKLIVPLISLPFKQSVCKSVRLCACQCLVSTLVVSNMAENFDYTVHELKKSTVP